MIGTLGWQELLIILVILALIFGASRVAGLGAALGKGIREFRQEARGDSIPAETKPSDAAVDAETAKSASPPSEESGSSD